jgi:L-seryl-tRNA(Ser) seleniumtransferase
VSDQSLLRKIPKTDVLLAHPKVVDACERYSYEQVKAFVRSYLDGLREGVLAGRIVEMPSLDEVASDAIARFERRGPYDLCRVINATGIVLHTNLGRAPLGHDAAQHVASIAEGYSNLELDLDTGKRGSRFSHVEGLLCELTGAEAAMVVNNNAGAVFLILNTLCQGERVALSRGELVEIGGSFRVPEIMARSGADLVEVGTTNKTHIDDYVRALEDGASVLLKVHTSNFVMTGFTESVSVAELSALAREHEALLLYDVGSATLFPSEALGIQGGVSVRSALKDGADLVCFSGDKLLGSAQAGIIVGRRDLVERIKRNQLARILRIDKLSLAALEMTLQCCRDPKEALENVEALRMLSMSEQECKGQAEALLADLERAFDTLQAEVVPVMDEAGGGSLPGVELAGYAVAVEVPGLTADELERALRASRVPIIARIRDGRVLLSVRTLFEQDRPDVVSALAEIAGQKGRASQGEVR